jgi:hypothetical protein
MSADMVELAGDLASFNNVTADNVLEAMKSALAGASEPMRRFGVDTRVARLEAIALEEGLIRQGQALDQTAFAQAVMLAIQRDSTDAMGDAARTVDSTANQMKFFARDVKELAITIGQTLIPAFQPLLLAGTEITQQLRALSPETQRLVIGVAAMTAAIGPLLLAMGTMVKLLPLLRLGFFSLNPLVAVAAVGVGALATAWFRAEAAARAAARSAQAATDQLLASVASFSPERAARQVEHFDGVIGRLQERVKDLRTRVIMARSAMAGTADVLSQHATPATIENTDELESQIEALTALIGKHQAFRESLQAVIETARQAAPAIRDTTAAMGPPERGVAGEGLAGLAPSIRLPDLISPTEGMRMLHRETETATEGMKGLGFEMESIAMQGVDAFIDFAGGAGAAIKSFVESALKQLARLLVFRAITSFLFPGSSVLGGLPGLGTIPMQHGGPVHPGQSYLVGERGPELFVPAQAGHIQPNGSMGGNSASSILAAVGPEPQLITPDALVVSRYWRRVLSLMAADGPDRGVRFAT